MKLLLRMTITILLISSLFFINVMQLLLMIIFFWNSDKSKSISMIMACWWWKFLVWSLDCFFNFRYQLIGHPLPNKENILLISNHQNLIDPLVILAAFFNNHGFYDLKWIVKSSLRYIPFLGWGLWLTENIFLSRDWQRDGAQLKMELQKFLYKKNPYGIVLFVEGTRLSPLKLKQSKIYCSKNHFPILEHVLFPRTKGFQSIISTLHPSLKAVYDFTISYSDPLEKISLWSLWQGKIGKITIYFRRYPIQEIPLSEIEIREWLIDWALEKDLILSKEGSFF